jgi:hypothetical protein
MRSDTCLGTFEEILQNRPPELVVLLRRLRDLIDEIDPDAVEVARPGESSVSYGVGPRKMSEAYAYLMPHTQHVNLGFYFGADLPDPTGLLEGSGKKLRHVKIRNLETVELPAIRALLVAAIDERQRALSS